MSKRTSISALLTALLLDACSGTPERHSTDVGVSVPSHWSAASGTKGPVAEQWLRDFDDAALSRLVREALSGNYDLKAAAARVKAAREQSLIEGAARWPQLFFIAGVNREKDFEISESGSFDALFNLSWEIDVWGRIRAAQRATEQEADATQADYDGARLSLAARTAQTYFELAEARQQADVAEQSIRDRQTIVELVRGRFARGLTRGLDLRLALTDLANAESQLAQARNQVQNSTKQLELLLGRYPGGLLTENSYLPAPPASMPAPPASMPAGLPSELLERRPDIIAAFARLRAMDYRVESAKKALLPRITLSANGGASSPALTELIDPRAAAWNFALGLAQPLFTGGRLKGEIRLNEALTDEALNRYRSTALNAFREVEQAMAAERWLREQEQALKEAVEQTEASRKLAVYSYRQGLIEILTLLDSYRSTLNAQSAYLTVRRQLLSNRINLYLALGGGI
jgi:multidrug efflux system outer membrane protein